MNSSYCARLKKIDKVHGRIEKSYYVISEWILQTKRFEYAFKKTKNFKKLNRLYKVRNNAIDELLRAGRFDIKVHKPTDNQFYWLYILTMELEGMRIVLTVPYNLYRKKIGKSHKSLEETVYNKDVIIIDGKKIHKDTINKRKFKLDFILENIEKSRLKLIDKMEGR